MASTKPVEEASQVFAADLAALRDDMTKVSSDCESGWLTQRGN